MEQPIRLFGIDLDPLDMDQAVARIGAWIGAPRGGCRYVVTPNVDHAVMYQTRADLRQAYRHASMVLADGMPLVVASRLLGKRLPERVAGSDLVPALFDAVAGRRQTGPPVEPVRVFLLGAAAEVAARAGRNIVARWPGVRIVGTLSPARGFESDDRQNRVIIEAIAEAQPDLLIVGLGAPKQELWVRAHRDAIEAKVALCVGATIDFLAGHKRRAPSWMRHLGLEWLHRLAREPRRLAARYAHDAWILPQLVWREVAPAR